MKKSGIISVLFIVSLLLIAGIYAYFVYKQIEDNLSANIKKAESDSFFSPSFGTVNKNYSFSQEKQNVKLNKLSTRDKLYVTTIPKEININIPNEFEVGVVSEVFKTVNKPDNLLVFDFAKHKNKLAFIAVKDVDFNSRSKEAIEKLYRLFINNRFSVYNSKEIKLPQGVWAPQNPDIYNNKLLFNAKTKHTIQKTSDWDIFIYSDEIGVKQIANGLYPKWINKDIFIFLGDDGIYLYDLKSGTNKNIWKIQGNSNPLMYFSLSTDKKYLAWTFPHQSKLIILEFQSKHDGVLSEKHVLNVVALWPVWREHDSKLAFINVKDFNGFLNDPNTIEARLMFYDVKGQSYINAPISKYNISDYVKVGLSKLNLWVK